MIMEAIAYVRASIPRYNQAARIWEEEMGGTCSTHVGDVYRTPQAKPSPTIAQLLRLYHSSRLCTYVASHNLGECPRGTCVRQVCLQERNSGTCWVGDWMSV